MSVYSLTDGEKCILKQQIVKVGRGGYCCEE
jgi:hypothetical protein